MEIIIFPSKDIERRRGKSPKRNCITIGIECCTVSQRMYRSILSIHTTHLFDLIKAYYNLIMAISEINFLSSLDTLLSFLFVDCTRE